jgi:serine/threonine-protein kinase RsbT
MDSRHSDLAHKATLLKMVAKRAVPRPAAGDHFQGNPPAEPGVATESPLPPDVTEVRVRLQDELGLVEGCRQSRQMAARGGFRAADQAIIANIVSELARNVLLYAVQGQLTVKLIEGENHGVGIMIQVSDEGPGILNVAEAMRDGYSSSGRSGLGLPGVRRLADDFDIAPGAKEGTTVTVRKWRI